MRYEIEVVPVENGYRAQSCRYVGPETAQCRTVVTSDDGERAFEFLTVAIRAFTNARRRAEPWHEWVRQGEQPEFVRVPRPVAVADPKPGWRVRAAL